MLEIQHVKEPTRNQGHVQCSLMATGEIGVDGQHVRIAAEHRQELETVPIRLLLTEAPIALEVHLK